MKDYEYKFEMMIRKMIVYDMIKNPSWMLDIWINELPYVMKALQEGTI